MGADIHLYIEYRPKVQKDEYDKRWDSFVGRINPGRDYDLFGRLANVRCEGALFEPRGLPEDAGYHADNDAHLFITNTSCDCGEGNYCSQAEAKRYIEECGCKYKSGSKDFVTHPDWHSHSWLNMKEFEQVLKGGETPGIEYQAVLAAMRGFEKNGYESRVVFWFDN